MCISEVENFIQVFLENFHYSEIVIIIEKLEYSYFKYI